MKSPLFSCVVPVKGARPYLAEALSSLKAQGMGDELEVIVQDGDVETDLGQSDALNKGFAKARGEWLFWLNADDVLLPGALRSVRDFINRVEHVERVEGGATITNHESRTTSHEPRLNWLAGDTVYIDEAGKVCEVRCDAKWRPWFGKKLTVWTGGPSAFFRRELWEKRGGFAADLKYAMDIDLWTRWAKAGERFVGLGEYVWGFRMHEGSKTMGGRFAAEQAKELAAIDARYGVSTMGFWRNLSRVASLLDGSWSKRQSDTARMRGKLWSEIAQ